MNSEVKALGYAACGAVASIGLFLAFVRMSGPIEILSLGAHNRFLPLIPISALVIVGLLGGLTGYVVGSIGSKD